MEQLWPAIDRILGIATLVLFLWVLYEIRWLSRGWPRVLITLGLLLCLLFPAFLTLVHVESRLFWAGVGLMLHAGLLMVGAGAITTLRGARHGPGE